nr:TCP-1/cpn60 chaperonin family protein [Halorhabdus rudnickae]
MWESQDGYGVIDPAAVKHEAVESATEAATMIVRIDDVIAAS